MEAKNTIILSDDLLKAIDQITKKPGRRSEFVESILRKYFLTMTKKKHHLKDFELINKNSEYLNREAEDALTYQVDL